MGSVVQCILCKDVRSRFRTVLVFKSGQGSGLAMAVVGATLIFKEIPYLVGIWSDQQSALLHSAHAW